MDKMTKIILSVAISITVLAVIYIMKLSMEKSRLSMEKTDLVQQINDQNTSINENKIEVEKQLQEAINQQKKDNEQTLEALRQEMKAAANSAAADLEAVRAERAQLTQTIAEKLKENGNDVEHVEYSDTLHAFFSWATVFESSKKAVDKACKSINKALG